MDPALYLPTARAILIVACVVLGFSGAEDRPGFRDGRTGVKQRWFVHSRDDS